MKTFYGFMTHLMKMPCEKMSVLPVQLLDVWCVCLESEAAIDVLGALKGELVKNAISIKVFARDCAICFRDRKKSTQRQNTFGKSLSRTFIHTAVCLFRRGHLHTE